MGNYSYDPNAEKIVNINEEEAIALSSTNGPTPKIERHHVLANEPDKAKVKVRKKSPLDVGPGSKGFANMIMLASIIGIVGVIVVYIIFRY